MQRSGAIGAKNAAVPRRSHVCAECGKFFRTGEDLFMHAEVCLLDAFEMEASAMQSATETGTRRSQGDSTSAKRPLPQDSFRSSKQDGVANSSQRSADVAAKPTATGETEGNDQTLAIEEDYDELDDDSDYEPPPELELAEPAVKKYKRVFPIGEDGKQIRPKMECPTCGLVLYRHNFSTHFRIHTGELPFQCSFCDKRFRTSSALTVHTRCHTGERPYECPHCNYCCITKRNLDRHIINNHVKKSNRARLSRADYYFPRRSGPSYGLSSTGQMGTLDYDDDDDDDDLEEDYDDENLDEAELEEEAGVSKIADRRYSKNPADSSSFASPAVPAVAVEEVHTTEAGGKQADGRQKSYESTYKRVTTVPILDGPKGVYGDPEQEGETEGKKSADASKKTTAESEGEKDKETEGQDADKESETQEASA